MKGRGLLTLLGASFIFATLTPQPHLQATTQAARLLEDPLFESDGQHDCSHIMVSDTWSMNRVSQGRTIVAPSHLDVNLISGIALAGRTQVVPKQVIPGAIGDPIVYAFWLDNDRTTLSSGYYFSKRYGLATFGDVAILPDASAILLGTVNYREIIPGSGNEELILPNNPPFHVRKFAMPPPPSNPTQLGTALASFMTDGVAAQIVLNHDGMLAHILTDHAIVHTIRTDTMM